ncbi:winged helix-turn-helix domain-containing protein [Pseudomonadota bacterium AL_CKDN230030165-1A_HGKHYDSX7]
MSTLTPSVLLCAEGPGRHRLGAWLSRSGFEVRECGEVAALFPLHAAHRCAFVVLAAPHADILIAAARLRTLHPGLGIVAITRAVPAEMRVQLLLCGVDSCLDRDASEREVAAVLQALARRWSSPLADAFGRAVAGAVGAHEVVPAAGPPAGGNSWRLQDDGWVLVSPNNCRLALSGSERALVGALMQAPTQRLSRHQLMDAVDVRPGHSGTARLRYVDVLVCRLRRKAAGQDLRLPIRAVHGWGYMFSAGA